MPNPKMEALNNTSSDKQVQEAISAEIQTCMGEAGADQKACAGKAFGMARQATGEALDFGR